MIFAGMAMIRRITGRNFRRRNSVKISPLRAKNVKILKFKIYKETF